MGYGDGGKISAVTYFYGDFKMIIIVNVVNIVGYNRPC